MASENSRPSERPTGTQALRRAIALLREVARGNRCGAHPQTIAEQLGIDRTTAHRMLRCMVDEGLLHYAPRERKYFLGPLAHEIGMASTERLDLKTLCRPVMARIAEQTGDTVFLMLRMEREAICIERSEGSYPVKTFTVDIGARRPLGVGAGSLAMLATLPPAEAELVMERNRAAYARIGGVDVDVMRQRCALARAQGHVVSDVIDVPGVRAAGVAIRLPDGEPVAALSVSSIELRMRAPRESMLLDILHRETEGLEALLAHSGGPVGRRAA